MHPRSLGSLPPGTRIGCLGRPGATEMATVVDAPALVAPGARPAARAHPLRRLLRRPAAAVGLVVIVAFVAIAAFAPLIAPYDPIATNFAAVRKAPSAAHWFGTDEIGRDVLSRVIFGARASLEAGVLSVLISLAIGVPTGLLAGYAGGKTDMLISRLTDALLACPFLILAIALAAFLGPSLANAMIAIGISATPVFVRLTRGTTLAVKSEDYVLAARAIGNRPWRIALLHVLPNIVPPLLVQATLAIAAAVIAEASLSFLGLGQQPPQPSWGSMLNTAKNYIDNAAWMAIWPGLSIFLLVLSFNLVGDGLRDALDPRHS
jgi:peptide/nickel transport system permease protein